MNIRSVLSKGLILVMLLSFSIIATGCWPFGGGEDQTLAEEQIQQKRVGTLKSLGGMSVGDGTHLLEITGGHTIRLRSNNIDLSQDKYLNHKVEVRGVISEASDGKDVMDVKSIDLSEDEEDDDMIKGEDKEYKNADLGFLLTYVDSWDVDEGDNSVTFTSPIPETVTEDKDEDSEEDIEEDVEKEEVLDPDVVIIKRLPNPEKDELETYMELPSDPNDLISLGFTQSLIGVDKLEGLKKESSDKLEIEVWLARGTYIYEFTFVGADTPYTLNNRNTYFSMISSFQFIGFSTDDEEDEETEDEDDVELPPLEEPEEEEEVVVDEPEEEEIEEVVVEEPEEEVAETTSSSSYGVIAQYINQTLGSIAPEDSDSGTWTATNFEFVDPNYVYVEYSDGSAERRVLLTYDQDGGLSTDLVGYFEPGETTSWERVDGENPVESAEKTVVTITDDGAQEAATVKEGYRYFESLPYDFNAQYPSNWYFSGTSGSGDVSHHYGFSNEPVEDGNELVSIDVVSGSLPSGSSISVGGHTGVKIYSGGDVAIYIERADGMLYKIHGGSENEQYVIDIAASIQAQ